MSEAPSATRVLTLTVVEGPQKGATFLCAGSGTFRVGRSTQAELRLTDPHVSRAQLLLEVGLAAWRLIDEGGRNPPLVNDRPLAANQVVELREGDRIRAGQTALLVGRMPPGLGVGPDEQDTWVLGGDKTQSYPAPSAPRPAP